MTLIGCEIIPEIVKIDPLASLDQGFGRRPVKPEMPEPRVVVDRFPALHAWKKGIHQNEFRYFGWELRSVRICDHQADVVSDYFGCLHTERLRQIVYADGCALHVQPASRNVGVANARQVGRDDREALRQRGNDRPPHQRGLRIAVQQDQRRTVASRHVMHLRPVDLHASRHYGVVRISCAGESVGGQQAETNQK